MLTANVVAAIDEPPSEHGQTDRGPAKYFSQWRAALTFRSRQHPLLFGLVTRESSIMSSAESRLADLGIELPKPVAPVANYDPFIVVDHIVYISGQISLSPDGLITGKLGSDLSVEEGVAAARICGINLLSQLKVACGGELSRVRKVIKLGGFVNCTPDFFDQPKVINGTSDLMVAVFEDAGRHARAAVGAPSLPLNASVEVDGIFEIS